MRRLLTASVLVLALAACGERQSSQSQPAQGDATWREAPAQAPVEQPRERNDGPRYTGKTY